MIICKIHGEVKGHSNGKNLPLRCSICSNNRVKQSFREQKEKALKYKGGKCEVCGYSKCSAALEFHHLDPKEKEFSIGGTNYHKWDDLVPELDKCQLLCANCHREAHTKLRI